MSAAPAFRLEGVGLVHPNGQRALAGLSLEAGPGERIAVIGPSGAGKTTLLRLLATSMRPGEGRLQVLGRDPWALSGGELRRLRARVGMAHQAPPLPPRQRVITAILAGRLGQWPWWRALRSLVYPVDIDGPRAQLERLELAERLFDRCDRLSGGQLQRVGVARVLYQRPELLLADEPVSAMDPTLSAITLGVLVNDAAERGSALLASLHAVDLALAWFPRIVGLRGGELAFDLPAREVGEDLLRDLYASEGGTVPTQMGEVQPEAPPPPPSGCAPRPGGARISWM